MQWEAPDHMLAAPQAHSHTNPPSQPSNPLSSLLGHAPHVHEGLRRRHQPGRPVPVHRQPRPVAVAWVPYAQPLVLRARALVARPQHGRQSRPGVVKVGETAQQAAQLFDGLRIPAQLEQGFRAVGGSECERRGKGHGARIVHFRLRILAHQAGHVAQVVPG